MDAAFFERLDLELRLLVDEIESFDPSDRSEILQFLDAGEYGIALETVFGVALEERKQLTPSTKMKIKSLAEEMGICNSIDLTQLR